MHDILANIWVDLFEEIEYYEYITIERPKPIEIYDGRLERSFRIIFDDMDEKEAVRIMVNCLKNGIPEKRVVKDTPNFLSIAFRKYSY